jgi:hypothetical protein
MEVSVARRVYSKAEHRRIYREAKECVYREAKLEGDARNLLQVLLARPTPCP